MKKGERQHDLTPFIVVQLFGFELFSRLFISCSFFPVCKHEYTVIISVVTIILTKLCTGVGRDG